MSDDIEEMERMLKIKQKKMEISKKFLNQMAGHDEKTLEKKVIELWNQEALKNREIDFNPINPERHSYKTFLEPARNKNLK